MVDRSSFGLLSSTVGNRELTAQMNCAGSTDDGNGEGQLKGCCGMLKGVLAVGVEPAMAREQYGVVKLGKELLSETVDGSEWGGWGVAKVCGVWKTPFAPDGASRPVSRTEGASWKITHSTRIAEFQPPGADPTIPRRPSPFPPASSRHRASHTSREDRSRSCSSSTAPGSSSLEMIAGLQPATGI